MYVLFFLGVVFYSVRHREEENGIDESDTERESLNLFPIQSEIVVFRFVFPDEDQENEYNDLASIPETNVLGPRPCSSSKSPRTVPNSSVRSL